MLAIGCLQVTASRQIRHRTVKQVTTEILTDLGIGAFTIKLNHRRLLDAMLDIAGVPAQKFRWVSWPLNNAQ